MKKLLVKNIDKIVYRFQKEYLLISFKNIFDKNWEFTFEKEVNAPSEQLISRHYPKSKSLSSNDTFDLIFDFEFKPQENKLKENTFFYLPLQKNEISKELLEIKAKTFSEFKLESYCNYFNHEEIYSLKQRHISLQNSLHDIFQSKYINKSKENNLLLIYSKECLSNNTTHKILAKNTKIDFVKLTEDKDLFSILKILLNYKKVILWELDSCQQKIIFTICEVLKVDFYNHSDFRLFNIFEYYGFSFSETLMDQALSTKKSIRYTINSILSEKFIKLKNEDKLRINENCIINYANDISFFDRFDLITFNSNDLVFDLLSKFGTNNHHLKLFLIYFLIYPNQINPYNFKDSLFFKFKSSVDHKHFFEILQFFETLKDQNANSHLYETCRYFILLSAYLNDTNNVKHLYNRVKKVRFAYYNYIWSNLLFNRDLFKIFFDIRSDILIRKSKLFTELLNEEYNSHRSDSFSPPVNKHTKYLLILMLIYHKTDNNVMSAIQSEISDWKILSRYAYIFIKQNNFELAQTVFKQIDFKSLNIEDILSDYNCLLLLTCDHLLKTNYFISYINKIKIDDFLPIALCTKSKLSPFTPLVFTSIFLKAFELDAKFLELSQKYPELNDISTF